MRKTGMLLNRGVGGVLMIGCIASAAASQGTAERECPKRRAHTAVMSYGTYSSSMSSDGKTVIVTPDGRVVAEELYSPNKRFYAYADLGTKRTTVYGIVMNGNIGRREVFWMMDGCYEMLGLSNDGKHLVTGFEGRNMLPIDYTKDQTMISFFAMGEPTGLVRLDQLVTDVSRLERTESGYCWGDYLGMNAAGAFVVETVDGEKVVFDVETAERLTYGEGDMAAMPDWKTYRDVLRCYEYRYPDTYLLQESLNYEGRPTDRASLKRQDSRVDIVVQVEEPETTYPRQKYDPAAISFEAFAVEQVKLWCSADGPNSSRYATDVLEKETFINPNGRKCVLFFLLVIHETYYEDDEGDEREEITVGPYCAVSISQAGEPYRALIFALSGEEGNEISDGRTVLRSIVDTVRILK